MHAPCIVITLQASLRVTQTPAPIPRGDRKPMPLTEITTPVRRPVESRDPRTGAVWRRFEAADSEEVGAAVAQARSAQPAWAALPAGTRMEMLRRFHDLAYARRTELAALVSRETGKPVAEALATEVAVVLDDTRFLRRTIPRLMRAPWAAASSRALIRKRVRVVPEPHGVVGVIAPWNYPFMLACSRLLPALATGNAVVFKPSEFTPSVGEATWQLLVESGVPSAVVQLIQGDGAVGAALVEAPVDKVFFTGSVRAGRAVAVAAARRLAPCELELGGSDAAIVCADANIPMAAAGLAWGRFSNAGQTCVAPKRVFVEAAAYDRFLEETSRVVASLRVGAAEPEADVGPMIRPEFRAVIEAQRDDALDRGARVVCTGDAGGPAFPPTVLADVPADARAMREETFGPLMVVTAVRDASDAVARANASEYGLSASVWSRDTARAGALASRLEAGTVAINDVVVTAGMPELPHGGVKQSGFGRAHGEAGILACLRTRGIVSERLPGMRQSWWFGDPARQLAGMDAFLRAVHDPSAVRRARAWPALLRFLAGSRRSIRR